MEFQKSTVSLVFLIPYMVVSNCWWCYQTPLRWWFKSPMAFWDPTF